MMSKKLKPQTELEADLAKSPEGMRELLYKHKIYNPTIHACCIEGKYQELSELDVMTMIAYYATIQSETYEEMCIEQLKRSTWTRAE